VEAPDRLLGPVRNLRIQAPRGSSGLITR
jgi:hypothetical protein